MALPFLCTFLPVSAPRSCTRDEGRPLGAGLQGQAPNHLKLLWSNARVVLRYEATNRDGGWPSEIGIQVPVSNRLKLLWKRNTR